ncbi:MAG: NAD-dependent epimerase/dehydratase family protein, partial [Kiritimatiellota bacterium]|nr:NAD-dependent epimerase/dehydratase family protein [Kiritimatiellota bacterium]
MFLAGVTGLAGHAIARRLLDGYPDLRLRACVHRTRPYCESPRLEYVNGDLRLPDDCRRMLRGCDAAIMAAASGGGAAVLNSEPWRQVNDNLFMAASFLEACFLEKVRRVVLANSATLYQECAGHVREEQLDLNQDPHPAYFGVGWVTRCVEKLCAFWRNQGGMAIVIGRTSNIFGPYASFDPGRSNFIPALIRKAVDRMDPFEVWGSPDVVRDVLYVEDFAR